MKDMFRNAMLPAGMASLMLAPAVVAFRLPLLAAEAGNGDPWRAETVRAVAEKASAMMEGGLAAQMVLVTSFWGFWPEALSGKVPSLLSGRTARMAAEAAMKPAARRVKANFRRLSAKG